MKIEKYSDLYTAIESAIYDIFDGKIPLEDPTETTKLVVKAINNKLKEYEN